METTRLLLIALGLITVLAVGIVSYVFGRMLSRPFKLLRTSLYEVADGNLDCRISEERRDDLGEVFTAFNRMVMSLESRHRKKRGDDA